METEYPPFLPSRPLHPARGCARFPNRHTDEKGEGRAKRGRGGGGGGSRRRDLENDSCLRKRGLLCFSSHGTLYTVPKVPLDLGQVRPLVRSNSRLFGTRSSVGVYPISIQHRCTTAPAPPAPLEAVSEQKGAQAASTSEFSGYFRARRPSNDLRIPREGAGSLLPRNGGQHRLGNRDSPPAHRVDRGKNCFCTRGGGDIARPYSGYPVSAGGA